MRWQRSAAGVAVADRASTQPMPPGTSSPVRRPCRGCATGPGRPRRAGGRCPRGPRSWLRSRRDVARGGIGAAAEEVRFHLALEVLARTLVGEVQPVLVDQHGLVLQPGGPGLLADVLVQALAELAGVGREVE